jgi:hypothetical protein
MSSLGDLASVATTPRANPVLAPEGRIIGDSATPDSGSSSTVLWAEPEDDGDLVSGTLRVNIVLHVRRRRAQGSTTPGATGLKEEHDAGRNRAQGGTRCAVGRTRRRLTATS